MIKQLGEETFYSNEKYSELFDIECPICFLFIFHTFFEIYSHCTISGGFECKKTITWQDIESYCNLRNMKLSQLELSYLLKIIKWVEEEINELTKDD